MKTIPIFGELFFCGPIHFLRDFFCKIEGDFKITAKKINQASLARTVPKPSPASLARTVPKPSRFQAGALEPLVVNERRTSKRRKCLVATINLRCRPPTQLVVESEVRGTTPPS